MKAKAENIGKKVARLEIRKEVELAMLENAGRYRDERTLRAIQRFKTPSWYQREGEGVVMGNG